MDNVLEQASAAMGLLISGDPDIWEIIGLSFGVSLQAMVCVIPPALVLAFVLAHGRFRGRRMLVTALHTLLAVPAIVIGVTLYLLLSAAGPLGGFRLLFSQTAMVIGQAILAFPIVAALAHSALQSSDRVIWETARTLGAGPLRAMFSVMHEVRFGLFAAAIAAFSRIIGEVGCAVLVGGNILHQTRTIPTAIAFETTKGEYAQGIALGIVLLLLALMLNFLLGNARDRMEIA